MIKIRRQMLIGIAFMSIVIRAFTACNGHHLNQDSQPLTATFAWNTLKDGNKRFVHHHQIHPDVTQQRITEVAQQQHPFAIIVSCSDSRVSPELIFDQGLGDLFVIRSAGNLLSAIEMGSIEYGVKHLSIPLVIIIGHERCGAIEAFTKREVANGYLKSLLDTLNNEPEIKAVVDNSNYVEACVKANVRHMCHMVVSDTSLAKRLQSNELRVLGAVYNLESGEVEFLQ